MSTFPGPPPKGFGLLQRERRFSQYEDPLVQYHKRPSLWVEPLGDWGAGAVHLVEIPAASEFQDNVVAFWVSERPATAGGALRLAYRLHWRSDQPFAPGLARVAATRTGTFGVQSRGNTKFAVDFEGAGLARITTAPAFAVTAPRGAFDRNHVLRVDGTRWRAIFEYAPEGNEAVDLRGTLRLGAEPLSETWLFRFVPRA